MKKRMIIMLIGVVLLVGGVVGFKVFKIKTGKRRGRRHRSRR